MSSSSRAHGDVGTGHTEKLNDEPLSKLSQISQVIGTEGSYLAANEFTGTSYCLSGSFGTQTNVSTANTAGDRTVSRAETFGEEPPKPNW